jgi:Tol biopolymer transport system component
VAFHSRATNLVEPDANGLVQDIYVHDRITRTTTRVSVSSEKEQANGNSSYPKISADGRYVVFESLASNLVTRDTNGLSDVFVHDRCTEVTTRVSVGSSGQGNSASFLPSISSDGRFVTFRSFSSNLVAFDVNNRADIFVRDRSCGTTSLVSVSSSGEQGDGSAFYSFVSNDGRFIVFDSFATNLVPFDTNGTWDVFVRDRLRGTTRLASQSTFGVQGRFDSTAPAISADGRFVAFTADADNLVPDDTNFTKDIIVRGPLHQ